MQCMIWFPRAISNFVLCDSVFVIISFKTMYDETIRLGFWEIENNQGLSKASVIGLGSFITLTVH